MNKKNEIICNCMGITRQEIEEAIVEHKCDTLEKVQKKTEAGTVCGVCVDDIEIIINEVNNRK